LQCLTNQKFIIYEPTGDLRLDYNSQVWPGPGSAAGNEAHHFVPFGLRSLGQ